MILTKSFRSDRRFWNCFLYRWRHFYVWIKQVGHDRSMLYIIHCAHHSRFIYCVPSQKSAPSQYQHIFLPKNIYLSKLLTILPNITKRHDRGEEIHLYFHVLNSDFDTVNQCVFWEMKPLVNFSRLPTDPRISKWFCWCIQQVLSSNTVFSEQNFFFLFWFIVLLRF